MSSTSIDTVVRSLMRLRPDFTRTNARTFAEHIAAAPTGVFAEKPLAYLPGPSAPAHSSHTRQQLPPAPKLDYFAALGIHGPLEDYDPRPEWRRKDLDPHTEVPIGFILDEAGEPTEELLTLDIATTSRGGSGTSGMAQGVTGSGKSFWLAQFVLTMATKFGPGRLNFVLMDFKQGASFIGFDKLPHVQAIITNLDDDQLLLERTEAALRGEMARRETLITKEAGCKDIYEYRAKRAKNPELNLPELPNLMVIGDEFRECIMRNPEFMKVFESMTQKGRSIGIHLLLASQFIDQAMLGDLRQNLTWGISLRAANIRCSQAVIGSPAAAYLPLGTGDAYLRRAAAPGNPGGDLTVFRGFDTSVQYVRPAGDDDASVGEFETQAQALLRHLSNLGESAPFQLWPEPLDSPLDSDD